MNEVGEVISIKFEGKFENVLIKAEYNAERDGNVITIDQVKRNAAFNRQIAANKAVANLLAIIQQLTANVNAAKADLSVLEAALNQAINEQRAAQ